MVLTSRHSKYPAIPVYAALVLALVTLASCRCVRAVVAVGPPAARHGCVRSLAVATVAALLCLPETLTQRRARRVVVPPVVR